MRNILVDLYRGNLSLSEHLIDEARTTPAL